MSNAFSRPGGLAAPGRAGKPPDAARVRARRRRRRRWALLAAAVVLIAGGFAAMRQWGDYALPNTCRAGQGSSTVRLDPEQARIASIIGGVAVRRGLSERAAVIATATAMQESKMRNLDHGDRDSLGVFQQRPSQGWGTPAQITDPVYATRAFYDHLVKVEGYEVRELTQVAQEVQRSGFPEAYAQHEEEATIIARAFTGSRPRTVQCRLRAPGAISDTSVIAADLNDVFGVNGVAGPGTVTVNTSSERGAAAIAAWGVANAARYGIGSVSNRERTWTRAASSDAMSWESTPGDGSGPRRTIIRTGDPQQ